MNSLTPIQRASLEARVAERAVRLFAEGYTIKQKDEYTFTIRNEEGTPYEVSTLWETCSCPFFKEHEYCKHLLGYEKLLATQQAYEDAQVAQLEAHYEGMENAEGYFSTNFGGVLW